MAKDTKSKLDQFADTLAAMEAEKKTLAEMLAWLKEEGCVVSLSTLSRFLQSQRSARRQQSVLDKISEGAAQIKRVQAAFAANPAPEMETLIDLHKTLVHHLITDAEDDPELLKLADQLAITAIQYVSGKTKAAQKERQLALAEPKFAETKKDEQTKALEYCLEEAKKFPAVQDLFRSAFAALKTAKETKEAE